MSEQTEETYLSDDQEKQNIGELGKTLKVLSHFENDEFWGDVTYGPLGSGKSRREIRFLSELRGEFETCIVDGIEKEQIVWCDWDAWKDWMVFMPEDFLSKLDFAEQKGRQLPALVWDDAGVWASNQRWAEDFSKSITQYVNVMRSDFANITLTTPNPLWLLKGFRTLPGGHITKVSRITGHVYGKHMRRARCYEGWMSPDLKTTGVKAIFDDYFSCKLPRKTSEEYVSVRRTYASKMKEKLKETYNRMKEEGKEKEAKRWRKDLADSAGVKIEDEEEKT